MRRAVAVVLAGLLASLGATRASVAQEPRANAPRVLESFDDARAFRAVPSDGVRLTLRSDAGVTGSALRMDFDFQGHAGYAVARRAFSLPPLPPHFAITLWVRGEARPNTLELKLVDSTGLNVWWMRRPELVVTAGWTRVRFRSTDLSYAWGPIGGGPPRGIAALEIAFTAGQGGRGWLALDDLTLTPLAAPVAVNQRPTVIASTSATPGSASRVVGDDFARSPLGPALHQMQWASTADGVQSLTLDFGGTRQLSALALDWSTTDWPVDYDIAGSDDGRRWSLLRAVRGSAGGRRFVHLPLTEVAALRITMRRSSRGQGYALGALHVLSDSLAQTRSAFLERVAAASAPGFWPRPLAGQQSYWTVVGLPRDERDALMSEDGNVESRPGGFSVEPFLYADGRLLSWRDGATTHSLDADVRPIPTVTRSADSLALEATTFATGITGRSIVWVRYRVHNRAARARHVMLSAVVRPVQVDPPWQFLGIAGGAATIRTLRADTRTIVVNDTDAVVAVTPPTSQTVATFDAVGVVPALARGSLTPGASRTTRTVRDPAGLADGAFSWALALQPSDSADVWLALPDPTSVDVRRAIPTRLDAARAAAFGADMLGSARALWNMELGTFDVVLPGDGAQLARTLHSALAYVLINARGPAIQPGTRSYRRSWIRDGALTSSGLMRLGHASDARAFLDWYAPHVFADGKVPCCVDARGSDPVTENDADGELLYLATELFRMTGDSATVRQHWPTLSRVATHLDSLRESRRVERYRTPDSLLVFGLLPPSISHEGYSDKPAYSYWDDWWGVRGLDDAATLARISGDASASTRFASAGREMRHDVVASVARAMATFHQETMPGAADRGDTDPTSSTIALEPAQALADLPRHVVEATFDTAWSTLQRRMAPGATWEVYTPYEWRDVGAYIRLGQPERAAAYSQWLLETQRPRAWNQWSEAIWRDARAPKFIGDMPHGWVLSDFVRATLDRIVYERERDSTLVVGAGIPYAWAHADSGVMARGIHTWWGTLALTMRPVGPSVRVDVRGVTPPRGIELDAPFGRTPRTVSVDGRPAAMTNGGRAVMIRAPAVVEFVY